jgi:CrcB protein
MERIVLIAVFGALGTVARYGVATLVQRNVQSGFPYGVMTVNLLGSLVFGVAWALSEEKGWISDNARVIVLVGFMGAFTTFSTFAFDNVQMARASQWAWLALNLVGSNVAGIALVFAGFRLGKLA